MVSMASGTTPLLQDQIIRYYDYTLPFYRWLWHGKTRGIHYGIWDGETKTHAEALINTNRVVTEAARITDRDVVLDAGCGVGGTALWIVRETGAHVTGITLSTRQAEKARLLAARSWLVQKTAFLVRNYLDTRFADGSFSVALGIESFCYAHDRVQELAEELYRVLKPGGRLVVADGFLGRESPLSATEQKRVHIFEEGFVLPGLISPRAFANALQDVGFRNVELTDLTERILPTARDMRRICLITYPFTLLFTALHLLPPLMLKNHRTGLVQQELFEKRALVYYLVTATK